MAHRDGRTPNISFVNSLVDCVSLGFNSVFNRKAKDMVTEQMPENLPDMTGGCIWSVPEWEK